MSKQVILELTIEVFHKAETLKRDRFIIFQFKILVVALSCDLAI